MVTVDIDRRRTARKRIQVDARNADLVGEVHPVRIRNRDVVVRGSTDPHFLDQRR